MWLCAEQYVVMTSDTQTHTHTQINRKGLVYNQYKYRLCCLCFEEQHSSVSAVIGALKTGYIEFARLESSADAIHLDIVNLAVAMAAEVHCQRSPA